MPEADPEAEIGTGGPGEQPPVAGEAATGGVVPQRDHRSIDGGIDVSPQGEAPQHPAIVDQPGGAGRRAVGAVGADDGVAHQVLARGQRHALLADVGHAGVDVHRAGIERRGAAGSVEPGPGDRHGVAGVGPPGSGRQDDAATRRTDDDHVAHPHSAGRRQPDLVEQPDTARPDQIAAGLVATRRRSVDQRDASPGACKHQRSHAAGGARADHHRVVPCRHRTSSPPSW